MHNHLKLDVWHRATDLSVIVCKALARTRPRRHRAILNQLERSITSVSANIAEGSGQSTDAKFAAFVGIAIGSATESMSHLAQLEGLDVLPREDLPGWRDELQRIRRMAESLQRRLLAGDLERYRHPLGHQSPVQSPRSPVQSPKVPAVLPQSRVLTPDSPGPSVRPES